jgi:hypothetical protein
MNYPTILRQEHPLATATTVQLQKNSKILAVRLLRPHRQRIYRVPYFEFRYTGLINPPAATLEPRTLFVVGTGHPVPDGATRYIDTVVDAEFIGISGATTSRRGCRA